MVDVGEEDGLRKGRLNVLARATIAVAACANLREEETACQQRCKRGRRRGTYFVVEGAVDLVLLGTEDGGEVVGHDCGGCVRFCGVVRGWREG